MRLCVPVTAFVQNCRQRGSDVNTKGSDTLVDLGKLGCNRHLFIYLFIIFYLLECLWSAKMFRIESPLAFTKPHLFGQFIFHQEPVLDQTMTN